MHIQIFTTENIKLIFNLLGTENWNSILKWNNNNAIVISIHLRVILHRLENPLSPAAIPKKKEITLVHIFCVTFSTVLTVPLIWLRKKVFLSKIAKEKEQKKSFYFLQCHRNKYNGDMQSGRNTFLSFMWNLISSLLYSLV